MGRARAAAVERGPKPRHLQRMATYEFRWPPRQRRVIDMTPDGEFREPPGVPLSTRVLGIAILVAAIAGAVAVAALALYVALALIPVAIAAGVVAYLAYRYRLWRSRRSFGGPRDLSRP